MNKSENFVRSAAEQAGTEEAAGGASAAVRSTTQPPVPSVPRKTDPAHASPGETAGAGHARKLRREREIAAVLARHGLVFLAHVLGLDRLDAALHREKPS